MVRHIARSPEELRAALRARRDELNLAHTTIEEIGQLPHGYFSKISAARPVKGITARMLQDVLAALALGVAAVVLIEDPEQAARMRAHWTPRKRPPVRGLPPAAAGQGNLELGEPSQLSDGAQHDSEGREGGPQDRFGCVAVGGVHAMMTSTTEDTNDKAPHEFSSET